MGSAHPLPTADQAVPLTSLEVYRAVPNDPGYYAAWITDNTALAEAGLDGPAPRLAYVGKAAGGLRSRLRRHVAGGLPGLGDILAARGKVLPPFGYWNIPGDSGRMYEPTPLTEISARQIRNWQQQHVRWAWATCSAKQAGEIERELIAMCDPLFNTQYTTGPLVQLRGSAKSPRSRARWLWHASWAGYLLEHKFRSSRVAESWSRAAVDNYGYPTPAPDDIAETRIVRSFPADMRTKELREALHEAARDAAVDIRDAVGRTTLREELEAWWAAHAAAEWLPEPVRIEEAMRSSLLLQADSDACGPRVLPNETCLQELASLVATLHGVAD